ncbi:MAG: hypothetical protein J7L96_03215 [Bacteroidales bacterium]|nr:hypothetical protein [Bacteroidales bacterium]
MDFNFRPDQVKKEKIPYYESARSNYAPYYSSTKQIRQAKSEVIYQMSLLDAYVYNFVDGQYTINGLQRYGYEIYFSYGGQPGIIRVAGLPIKSETQAKINKVKIQALLNVRDWLKTSLTQMIFNPGSNPLLLNLLAPGSNDATLGEYFMSGKGNKILALEPGEVAEAEFEIINEGVTK